MQKLAVKCTGLNRCEEDFQRASKFLKISLLKHRNIYNRAFSATLNYIFGKYGPDWYQAMTSSQMTAANSLHESVLEDLEQGTVSRCDKCLRGIGIKPIERISHLLLAVTQSKGNDMAFLWFVLQMFYTSDGRKDKKTSMLTPIYGN